ncbi:MAG: DDE-type integrase/transposase/recombinase [archaeon]
MNTDEKYVKVNGKDCYDLNCIDSITKFATAHLFVDKRSLENCVKFLSQIKERCYDQILVRYYTKKFLKIDKRITFVCDGFWNYKNAFNKLFYRVAKLQFGVPIACKKFGLKHNNNPVERYNGKLKDRMNARRGEFKSFEYAKAFMNLQHVINNFVNPHQQLGEKTPAERAGIKLKLGRSRLLGLIKETARNLT